MADDEFFTVVTSGEVREDDVPRDGLGRYLLPDPGGDPNITKGRTRVTTVSGTMENGYGLAIWRRRTVVRGMGLRPDLMARAGAADPEDPSYDKLLDSIEAAAYEAGGGSAGSNLGSAQHSVFERYFGKGEPIESIAEYFHPDIRAVEAELARKKIKIIPEYRERVVYCSVFDRGGKIDAIGELDDGTWAVVDWKTERDPIAYPDGKTIQLGYYVNSEYMMDYSTQRYAPMPAVRRDFAIVVWCRPGSGEAKALAVPVDLGWVGARVAEHNRAWKQQKIVISEYLPGTGIAPAVVSQVAAPQSNGQPAISTYSSASQEFIKQSVQPQGVAAAVGQVVDQALASGQQLGAQQITELNSQAAAIVASKCGTCGYVHTPEQGCPSPEWAAAQTFPGNGNQGHPGSLPAAGLPPAPAQPPGQPVVGPGTPHPVPHTTQPPAPPLAVPPGPPPPAPKGAGKNASPAEYIQELIARSSEGVDLEAFYLEMIEELTQLSKKEMLQPMLRLIQPGIDEKSIAKHRQPLAEMLTGFVKQQRELRTAQSPPDYLTYDQQAESPVQVPPQQPQIDPNPSTVAPWAQQPPANGFVDMTYEGVMRAIHEAPNMDRLTAIYNQWVATYGIQQWTGTIVDEANKKLAELQQYAPAH
jgi:hypothetical protein